MSWELSATTPDDQRWLGLLQEHEHLLFHEPVWASVMTAGLGADPVCLLLSENGAARGGLIGFSYRVSGTRMPDRNLLYCGPLIDVSEFDVPASERIGAAGVDKVAFRLSAATE